MHCTSNPPGGRTPLVVAVDTEFHDAYTLTVQAAARVAPDVVAVQVYYAAGVPRLPIHFHQDEYLPVGPGRYGRFCGRVLVRPAKPIPPFLSPLLMAQDLWGLEDLNVLSRHQGRQQLDLFGVAGCPPFITLPANLARNPRSGQWQPPVLDLTLVAHFQRADFLRCLGRDFLAVLQNPYWLDRGKLVLRSRKLIEFVEQHGPFARTDPLLEYLRDDADFFGVRVRARETMLPFGPASLDRLSQTFLGLPKSDVLGPGDKQDMLRTFRERPCDAYGYAMVDAVNTLLVYEQMQAKDRSVYAAFGFSAEETPPLRATLGGRVGAFVVATTRKAAAAGSRRLQSGRALRALMRKGGVGLFRDRPGASRYGPQTGQVHGGLLYTRSPTKLWHEAPGMLRDVDMAGCYNEIAARTNVYWGRPVVLETGSERLSLADAVRLVQQYAPPDGWMVRVAGVVGDAPNALIPSTDGAITSANYCDKLRNGKRRQAARRAFQLEGLRDPASVQGTGGGRLYSDRVDSGVVTESTWRMIRALPPGPRQEYERMTADSVIFYPRDLAAEGGPQFDALVEKYQTEGLPWSASLDLERRELVRRETIDADYVTLKYPLGTFARRIGLFRKDAQRTEGKGSGLDLAWKLHANTAYGVLASPHLPTNNFVAANQITAHGRAEAFALGQALNAIQTITDGCTYRLDQVPACTFAECLRLKPDYPIRRAEDGDGIPFLDPATIPQADAEFTLWYRDHARRFFDAEGPEFSDLVGAHALEHKQTGTTGRAAFDALACDGSGNYVKLTQDGGGWRVDDFAARSYGRRAKAALQDWLVRTYSTDRLTELAPVVEDVELLSFNRAAQRARVALDRGVPEVFFPLGLSMTKVLNYKAIKLSAFVFRTPEQRVKVAKQLVKFEDETGCGLELLAWRRTYQGRREGSPGDVAEAVYRLIREGKDNLGTALNLAKRSERMIATAEERSADVRLRKARAEQDLHDRIDVRNLNPVPRTGYVVTAGNLVRVREEPQEIIMQGPEVNPV